jgi:hypothetical protein
VAPARLWSGLRQSEERVAKYEVGLIVYLVFTTAHLVSDSSRDMGKPGTSVWSPHYPTLGSRPDKSPPLPVELWIQILGFLHPHERRELAAASSWFFSVVHTKYPFCLVVTDSTPIEDILSRAPIFREWGAQLYWAPMAEVDPCGDPPYRRKPPCSPNCSLLHLATFSRLTSIDLVRMTINPDGQHTIYSLPDLRSITLRVSQFQPTMIPLPNHRVAHLRLFNIGSSRAFHHVLRQVSGTLTALEVYSNTCEAFLSELVYCPLLRSIALELEGRGPLARTALEFLELHPQVTELTLNCISFPVVGPSLLPNLRTVIGTTRMPRSLLESRPIEAFSHHSRSEISLRPPYMLWDELEGLKKAPRRHAMRALQVACGYDQYALSWIHDAVGCTLQQLYMWVAGPSSHPMDNTDPYAFLLGKWSRPSRHAEDIIAFPRLKHVLISFQRDDRREFPLAKCFEIYLKVFLPICPALEEVELFAISSYERIQREQPQKEWWVRFWKDGLGRWHRRMDEVY